MFGGEQLIVPGISAFGESEALSRMTGFHNRQRSVGGGCLVDDSSLVSTARLLRDPCDNEVEV